MVFPELEGYYKGDPANNRLKELSYIKILGLSKNGKKYYSKIKKDINIKVCNKFEKDVMNTELKASYLYSIITNDKNIFNSEIINHTITK